MAALRCYRLLLLTPRRLKWMKWKPIQRGNSIASWRSCRSLLLMSRGVKWTSGGRANPLAACRSYGALLVVLSYGALLLVLSYGALLPVLSYGALLVVLQCTSTGTNTEADIPVTWYTALARATLAFCPPLSVTPFSPTSVWSPAGSTCPHTVTRTGTIIEQKLSYTSHISS